MFVSWILSPFLLVRIEATYRSFPDSRLLLPPSNGAVACRSNLRGQIGLVVPGHDSLGR